MESYAARYNNMRARILNGPQYSFWLKDQIIALERRDTVDALRDAESLLILAELRFNGILNGQENRLITVEGSMEDPS